MELSFSMGFWRYALLVECFIIMCLDVFFISGVVLVYGGAGSVNWAYTMTALGSVYMTVSFIGCFASLRNTISLNKYYVGTTLFCISSQLIFLIVLLIVQGNILEAAEERMIGIWNQEKIVPGSMDGIQQQYYCCGWMSYLDHVKNDTDELPSSCCLLRNCNMKENMYFDGCYDKTKTFFNVQINYLIWITLSLIGIEAISVWNTRQFRKSVLKNTNQA